MLFCLALICIDLRCFSGPAWAQVWALTCTILRGFDGSRCLVGKLGEDGCVGTAWALRGFDDPKSGPAWAQVWALAWAFLRVLDGSRCWVGRCGRREGVTTNSPGVTTRSQIWCQKNTSKYDH